MILGSCNSGAETTNAGHQLITVQGWLRKHASYYRDRRHDTDSKERPSCRFPLIFIEPIRNQQTEANAQCNPRSGDQHDFWNRNRSLC